MTYVPEPKPKFNFNTPKENISVTAYIGRWFIVIIMTELFHEIFPLNESKTTNKLLKSNKLFYQDASVPVIFRKYPRYFFFKFKYCSLQQHFIPEKKTHLIKWTNLVYSRKAWLFLKKPTGYFIVFLMQLNNTNQAVKVSRGGSFVGPHAPRRSIASALCSITSGLVPMHFELVFCYPLPLGAKRSKSLIKTKSPTTWT